MEISNIKEKAAALLKELEDAFPPYSLDDGISLSQAALDDDYECDNVEKMRAAYEKDVTNNWRDVSDETLETHFQSFSVYPYLDNKGWRYYLPAALRHILRNPSSACEFYTRIHLVPGKTKSPWNVESFSKYLMLTKEQGRIITKILVYMRELDPAWFLDSENTESENHLKEWIGAYLDPQ